ncbi:hypothetical protein ABEV41_15950, partial [Geobacillus thermodenitrificans]|uniref:hypothetical protein n=1 Tax=Geobacillus thermodenitrificans TaxID=33940 RepID=UPI003D20CC2E
KFYTSSCCEAVDWSETAIFRQSFIELPFLNENIMVTSKLRFTFPSTFLLLGSRDLSIERAKSVLSLFVFDR